MLEILMELGLTEEMALKVISAFEEFEKEKKEVEEEEKIEEKPELSPMGKAEEDIPSKEEFEKMGYLARVELAKTKPELYDKLKNGR